MTSRSWDLATSIDLDPSRASADWPSHSDAPTLIAPSPGSPWIAGRFASLEDETARLLRRRLRAALLLLVLGLSLYFVRNMFLPPLSPKLRELHTMLVLLLGTLVLALSWRDGWTLRSLRRAEWGTFAMVGLYAWLATHVALLERLDPKYPEFYRTPFRDTVRGLITIVILYGTFLPNTWKGAARVAVPLALTPFLAMASVAWQRPDLMATVTHTLTFEQWSGLLIAWFIGLMFSLYGAHTIHDLRSREFASRRFGQYRLIQPLGRGGMGQVYLAEHALLKRPCALKVVRPEAAGDASALARFELEVQAMARLNHPNTVEVFDYGRAVDGSFYCVMEYLRGQALDQIVSDSGPMSAGRVIHLLRPICLALAEAHARGLVHRDVKPANIFAAEVGGMHDVAKLLDFGLVKITRGPDPGLSRDGAIRGTPLFMSPEQGAGLPIDGRSDLYSLGAVAYYLLTGRPPFDAINSVSAVAAHRFQAVGPPSSLRAGVPADLEVVVLRCLAKSPGERYADTLALERALASCEAARDWGPERAASWWRGREAVKTVRIEMTTSEA
jgi:serine/threonine-protein kinase